MRKLLVLALFLGLALSLRANFSEILQSADAERIQALSATEAEESQKHLANAIGLYEEARQKGLASGPFFSNLGTLYLRQGDYARAILNLKKALLFTPRNQHVIENLNLARGMRADHFKEDAPAGVIRTLAAFHYDLGYDTRVAIAIAAWIIASLTGMVLLWEKALALQVVAILSLITAVSFGSSAAVTVWSLKNNAPGVITAEQTMPRMGDGDAYSPATTSPIHAGTEITIQKTRGEWSLVTLPGDIHAWLKNADFEK